MSRILKRPMFRTGGSTNSGIMHGLVDRKGYSDGPTQAEIYGKEQIRATRANVRTNRGFHKINKKIKRKVKPTEK